MGMFQWCCVVEAANSPRHGQRLCARVSILSPGPLDLATLKQGCFIYIDPANHLTIFFPEIVVWLQWSTILSRANTAVIYILTSEICAIHQYAAVRFNFVSFHLHTAEIINQMLRCKP